MNNRVVLTSQSIITAAGGAVIILPIPQGEWVVDAVYIQYSDDANSVICRIGVQIAGAPQEYWLKNNVLLYDGNNNEIIYPKVVLRYGDNLVIRYSNGTAGTPVYVAAFISKVM